MSRTLYGTLLVLACLGLAACGGSEKEPGADAVDVPALEDVAVGLDALEGGEDVALDEEVAEGGEDAAREEDGATEEEVTAGSEYCPVVNYHPCGGELLGTWAFRALCPEDPEAAAALCEHPYDNKTECTGEGNEAICASTHTGTLTFQDDGMVDIETAVTLVSTWHFTDECLAVAVPQGNSGEERCAQLDTNEKLTCTYDGGCTCVGEPMSEGDSGTADYVIDGQDLMIGEDPPSTWCVDGDILTMDFYAYHPISWRYWVLERQ